MSRLEEPQESINKDINIMDTDGGDEEDDDGTNGIDMCMGSPIVNVEDDSLSADLPTLNMDNQSSTQCDINNFANVRDDDPISDATSINLDVLDDLRLSSDQPEDDLYIGIKDTMPSLSFAGPVSRPTSLFNCQNLEKDVDLLKPVVFSNSIIYSGKTTLSKPKPLGSNTNISKIPCDLNSKTSAASKTLRESTAVTSVLPNATMTTILCGLRTNTKIYNQPNQCSTLQSKSSLDVKAQDENLKIYNHKYPLRISSNVMSHRSVTELEKLPKNKKFPGRKF